MIRSFRDSGTEDVFNGRSTKADRKVCPSDILSIVRRKLDLLDSAEALMDLRVPPGNRLEALSGDRKGQHSIRINQQYRVCFSWMSEGPETVEIADYH
ncbi:MAG: type II toxin-antitoxin system RelE/ParE family toxin [Kiritimatiellia bacterium]|nr:type II toxin-antitoxin system RelE/ParE family toxin [Kiritimatiellia bacterium]MDP6848027.1 type II toxin-antitoxin system RelE/ParE family toxin [Kiritimatiellia bacterium]